AEWHNKVAQAEIKNMHGVVHQNQAKVCSRAETVEHLLGTLTNGATPAVTSLTEIDVVGHRVVHGGPKYEEPVSLTPEVRAGIAKASAFAPLHNRAELEGIEITEKLLGRVPQVAVFDTGFHRKMPQAAAVYPGPYQWLKHDIRRYGFLGLSAMSRDIRDTLAENKLSHSRAKSAFDIYDHRLQAGIGAMVAVLGGINALIFSGGVGENSAEVREAACKQLTFLGLKLDDAANRQRTSDRDIAARDSRVRALIIRAQEDWAIARECWGVMRVSTDEYNSSYALPGA